MGRLIWVLMLPFSVAAALLLALWFWTDTDTSLASALGQAARYLPAGQTLVAEDVRGSLRRGGHLGLLRWQSHDWVIEARQIDLIWQPIALFDQRLQLDTLHVGQLTIDDTGPPSAHVALKELVLPFQVDVNFVVDALRWNGPPALDARAVTGRYQFDKQHHALTLANVQVADGQYNATATLQARAPLTVDAQVHGKVEATVPGGHHTLPLDATASVSGNLAGPEGLLDVQATLQPNAAQAMRASVSAQIKPWAVQPVSHADAHFNQLNLAALWSGMPQTLLTGDVQVVPQITSSGQTWQARGKLTNGLSGPVDKGRLPVDNAQAQVTYVNGQWLIQSLTAAVAGGQLQVQGQMQGQVAEASAPGATAGWQGTAQLQNINPATIHSQMAAARVDGKLVAKATAQAIEFDAQLQPAARQPDASRLQGLRLKQASATGRWAGGLLSLQTLQVKTDDALLQGHVALRPASKSANGQLQLTLPGGQARIEGLLGVLDGVGDFSLHVADAAQALRWLVKLPGMPQALASSLATTPLQGQGELTGHWQGGWQALRLSQVNAQWAGQVGSWTARLQQPLDASWEPGPSGGTLNIGAGEAAVTGPLPGLASVVWQPLQWSQNAARTRLQTRGQLKGLPMAWLELLGHAELASVGLSGDLLFDGDWDVALADTLKLRASLVRRSGDILVRADIGGTGNAFSAGVREARLTVTTEGDGIRAALRWDSERAGNAQADFSTRFSRGAGGWTWAADAPLTGSLQARLPQVGVWSVLAPPGWRIRGTLDASIALAGTRQTPQWSGTLQADDLLLRSVVDGIEFNNGRLRTAFKGQRLDITEFSVKGASGGGSTGGQLTAKGFALWLPDSTGATANLSKIHMELDATASALRLSARADRRLVVSGGLQARLDGARLEVRGALKADQALFILPDETAPSLGDDVVIKAPVRSSTPLLAPNTAPGDKALRVKPDLALTLDLGPNFRVEGRGLATRLSGLLALRSAAGTGAPRLTGEVRTVSGTYKAYGQLLDVDEGVLRFTGAYDNPALDILAIRPNLGVRVGVQISGTALAPRVRLYADPDLPDAEKLAWLVLGRAAANAGAESALLQQAALALLGGNGKGLSGGLATALGLDELSFAGPASNADGSTTSATVTLGKRLSRDFYVAYERSLAGTLGTFYIFYDLSRRFTLRAKTGEQSAIDLIFTVPYD